MRNILVLLLAIKLNCQSTFNYTFAQQNLAVNDYGLTWSISHSYMFVIFSAIESTVVTTSSGSTSFASTLGDIKQIVIGNTTQPENSLILVVDSTYKLLLYKYNSTSKFILIKNFNLTVDVDSVFFGPLPYVYAASATAGKLYCVNINTLTVSLNYTFTGELPFLLSFDQNIAIMTRNTSLLSSGRFLILSSSLTLVQSVPFTGYDFATSVFNYDFDSNCILRG